MGTTANNSWPYPESSDYVADGATAIENLADAIDTGLGDVTKISKGRTGFVERTTTAAVSSTAGSILSTNIDVITGRNYMVMTSGWTYATSTLMTITNFLYVDGVNRQTMEVTISNTYDNANVSLSTSFTASSTATITVEWTAQTSTGTTFIRGSSATRPHILIIDLGE